MRTTSLFRLVSVASIATLPAIAHADTPPTDFTTKAGVVVRAQAYIDKSYSPRDASRYSLGIVSAPKDSHQWDFTVKDEPQPLGGINGISSTPYDPKKPATIQATLHQYETYEERVTLNDLDLAPHGSSRLEVLFAQPKGFPDVTPRYLAVQTPVTATTPSGITITLPAQGKEDFEKLFTGTFGGNLNALFFAVQTTPNTREVMLPQSPLCQQYHRPVTIKLECVEPNFMVWYMADNTFKNLAVSLPNLKTLTHLDSLTIIVRQRVELQAIPLSLKVPVEIHPKQ